MGNYGKCKDCQYGEPLESGWRWHCTWYKTLEDPDEVRDCAHYKRRNSGTGCFLTTACCVYKGLDDDCRELQAFRKLRDEYIKGQSYGEELINNYYEEAPKIVEVINASDKRDEILEDTYQKIVSIVEIIEKGDNAEAVIQYMMLLHKLSKI